MGMSSPQVVKRYAVEVKLAALDMNASDGVWIQRVAETLCIHLGNWCGLAVMHRPVEPLRMVHTQAAWH